MQTVFRTDHPLRTGHAAADSYWRAEVYRSGGKWKYGDVGTRAQLIAAAQWCAERNERADA